jgi:ATP-binding cassette subfamily B protein
MVTKNRDSIPIYVREAISALDYKTDRVLRGALKTETAGITCMIVAQRIGTVMDADRIIVLNEGRVVGKGKHKDLLRTCEVYRQIAMSQLSEEELVL